MSWQRLRCFWSDLFFGFDLSEKSTALSKGDRLLWAYYSLGQLLNETFIHFLQSTKQTMLFSHLLTHLEELHISQTKIKSYSSKNYS